MKENLVQVGGSLEALIGKVADEFLDRQERGEQPDVEEYAARHPEAAPILRKVLNSLRLLDLSGPPDSIEAESDLENVATGTLGDFRLMREIGRGGMGVVYEAEQISLRRRVALKVLPFAGALDPRQLQRFKNESLAAAQLHHTNIVPVFGVGCERGVHYYAMQYIEGQTLGQLIGRQRGADPAAPDQPTTDHPTPPAAETAQVPAAPTVPVPRWDYASFRRVAEWGVQAALGLDHAHQQGVVHRDIKPANLLVDEAGNLWITDFGLAQVQTDVRLTLTGDLVGTLRYMSPEQALARRVVLDHRTDIYSLGATLYELLTLEPAFGGEDRQELLRQIAFEEARPPRRINKAIPAELEVIVQKAMEKNPADRYATAQELGDDLRRWLEDRPIRARRPTLAQRARKWRRRHRALVWAVTGLVLAALVLGGAALWREERQRAAVASAVEAGLERADLLQQQERWEDALAVLTVAEGQLEEGGASALRERVKLWKRDVDMLTRLEKARLQRAAGGKVAGFDDAGADRLYAGAFEWYGLDVTASDPQEVAERVRASAICTHLTTGLDEWSFVRDQLIKGSGRPLRALANLADKDPWRRRMRGAAGRADRAALERLGKEKEALTQPPATLVLLAWNLNDSGSWAAQERVLKQAQQRHPGEFWVNFELANFLCQKKLADPAEAARFYQAALALRPQSPVVYNNLGEALYRQRKLAEAEAAWRKAIALQPDLAAAHSGLGAALQEQGKLAEAVAACRKAVALRPDYSLVHYNLGVVLAAQGKLAEAVTTYQKAISLQPDSAVALANLGAALAAQREWQEAVKAYQKAIKLEPDSPRVHYCLGIALNELGKLAEAVAAYKQAIAHQKDHAEAHWNLGLVLQRQGCFADSLSALKRGHEIGSRQPNWPPSCAQRVHAAERLVELDAKLANVLREVAQPRDAAERIALAHFCQRYKRRNAIAARFSAEAFAARPALATDLNKQHRYNAACTAALAGCGQGEDAADLDARERARLLKQALDWLRADLAKYAQLVNQGRAQNRAAVQQRLKHWQQDADFAGVRGDALDKLPEGERREWQKLWQEVEALRQRAAGPQKPGGLPLP